MDASLRHRKRSTGKESSTFSSESSVAEEKHLSLRLKLVFVARVLCCTCILVLIIVASLANKKIMLNDSGNHTKVVSIIPLPVMVAESTDGTQYFTITSQTTIAISEGIEEVGQYLQDMLIPATGFQLAVKLTHSNALPDDNFISLNILSSHNPELGSEGYLLEIKESWIAISSNRPAGIFYAIQTLRQLLPPSIEARTPQPGPWRVPAMIIRDYPDYSYRGAMLDVARHFFQVQDVKRFIDFLAMVKMNHFHIHLTDDQGWRIEIKKWPNLTVIGGSTQVGGGKGGFFTQDQYKEIVKYAADRFIITVLEIDMPGHTNAALASYPELNCDGKAPELYTNTAVGFSSLCIAKNITYTFVDDVIGEVAAITAGPYFHIGGDESLKTEKGDYIQFLNRAKAIVKRHGKTIIGWDEVALADGDTNSVVQFWNHKELAQTAIRKQMKLILSPSNKAYLDMKYDKTTRIGFNWSGYIDVEVGYTWDLETFLPQIGKESILGIEAPLWTETVVNMNDIEYLTFPRLPGYAEIGWSPAEFRNWDTYKVRLGQFGKRMKMMGINFHPSELVPWVER